MNDQQDRPDRNQPVAPGSSGAADVPGDSSDLDALLVVELPEPGTAHQKAAPGGDQFHPEPFRRRRLPATRVVGIVAATLLLTLLLDADGLLRTAERQDIGWRRTVALDVMRPVDRFAHSLYLDRPRIWLADATGHHQSTHIRSTAGVQLAREAPKPRTARRPGAAATTTTTTLPAYRTPTAADPLRILVAGDSLSDGIGLSLSNALDGLPATVDLDRQVGTGLARPDVIDWPGELTRRMDADDPDVVVLIFGGNDAQALRTPDGWIRPDETDAWRDEYERRVAQMMNIAARPGVSVYWIGMPVTNVPSIQAKVPVIDSSVAIEAKARAPQVTYVDPGPALEGPGGSYTATLPDSSGRQVVVRHDDGVHMTVAGTDRVVALFIPHLVATRHLTAPPPTTTRPRATSTQPTTLRD